MNRGYVFVAASAVAILSVVGSAAAQTSFFDGDFPNTSWSSTKIVDTTPGQGAVVSAERVANGGNPDAFRQAEITLAASGQVVMAYINAPANYWPLVQGEFQTIEGEVCLHDISAVHSADAEYRLLILQGDSYYVGGPIAVAQPGSWASHDMPRTRDAGFTKVSGTGPANPDFGPTGDFFEMGYAVMVNGTGSVKSTSGIDNWSIKLGFCYADCDESGGLDFFDFLCFQNAFAFEDMYADCDGDGVLDFFDFLCFQNQFAFGC